MQHLPHRRIHILQLYIPTRQSLVNGYPLVQRLRRINHKPDIRKLFLIAFVRMFLDYLPLMHMLLQAQQNLTRINRFNKVIGNLRANSLFHDMLLFALRYHHHRHIRPNRLQRLQRLQTAQSRHVLIQEHNIHRLIAEHINSVLTVRRAQHLIAFFFQVDDIRLQQLHLVICPQYRIHNIT